MSRYQFNELVSNCDDILEMIEEDDEGEEEPKDIKGYSLYDWQRYGEVGWDEPLATYFIQLIFREGELGQHGWWLGTSHSEIPDFLSLCRTINKIFSVQDGYFSYTNCISKR